MIEPVGEHHVVVSCIQSARGMSSGIPVEMDATYMFEMSGRPGAAASTSTATREEALAEARRGEAGEPTAFD